MSWCSRKADRHTLIVALGGGVVGDLAGLCRGHVRPRACP